MRYLIFSVSLLCGCGTTEPNTHVVRTGADDFVAVHRLTPEQARKRFAGRLVQIYIPPGTHVCDAGSLGYRAGGDSPIIVFHCRDGFLPPDAGEAALVTGRYVGMHRDGVRRGAGIDWKIVLSDCSVTRLSP